MRTIVIRNLTLRFDAYADLIAQVDDTSLKQRISAPKHKSLSEHLWCIVGARESYARALETGSWSGFNCSMQRYEVADFSEKLKSSARAVLDAIADVTEWTNVRDELLVALAEHEVMHEGQIIRHVYGFEQKLPGSWRWA